MPIFKDFRFSVVADWIGGTRALVRARGKPALDISVASELHGDYPELWSPEELLLAACASSYELTLERVAEQRRLPLRSLEVRASGHVTRRHDGHRGFVAIELDVDVVTDADRVHEAKSIASLAQSVCIVTQALDVPLHVRVSAGPPALEEVTVP